MSNLNIKRTVENIRSETNIYTPITEIIVNAIQAIEEKGADDRAINIQVIRSPQVELDDSLPEIIGFVVLDNGIGFTEEHRNSFDTLYSAQKISEGGKGFGRFTCLKYYDDVNYESIYIENDSLKQRTFSMGKETEIIVNEKITHLESGIVGTRVKLIEPKKPFPDKPLEQVARRIVEKLLPYFISENHPCPEICLSEEDYTNKITLNNYIGSGSGSLIVSASPANGEFAFETANGEKHFSVQSFKIYSPSTTRSKINLVAHRRQVQSTSTHKYIPEFAEEFYEVNTNSNNGRNFIISTYVIGDYLDSNVSLERGGFDIPKDSPDSIHEISLKQIEEQAAQYSRQAVNDDVEDRKTKKVRKITDYVRDHAPWHRDTLSSIDYSTVAHNPSPSDIDALLHKHEYKEEIRVKGEVRKLLAEEDNKSLKEKASDIARQVSDRSKNELAHYISLRKSVLDLFEKSLEKNSDGSYSSEDLVHDIIFPVKRDSENTPFHDHNLWIIDERLTFTEYLTSDKPMSDARSDRPDILAYNKRIGFRGENEASNPVTIFEFKKPQRDDFVNPSAKEDPIEQITRYVSQIRKGKFQTPKGREIVVGENTPFYGYVICTLTPKVKEWLKEMKDFKVMPDGLGYFRHHESLNLYIEVWSWDKALKDACMRNRIFFEKLGMN